MGRDCGRLLYLPRMTEESMENFWNDNWQGNNEVHGRNPPQCYSIHYKSHTDGSGDRVTSHQTLLKITSNSYLERKRSRERGRLLRCTRFYLKSIHLHYGDRNNINLCLCLIKHHAPKKYGAVDIQNVPGGQVSVLGGHSIVHSNTIYCTLYRRATRHVLTRVAKCIDVDGRIFENDLY
jgi:hypothetical protein